jgi:hypothetical protein
VKWQGDPAAGPAKIPGGRLLWRFKVGGPSDRDLARQAANEALMPYQISEAIDDYQQATAEQPPVPPVIIEHPIDPDLQDGNSRLLGGGMEIHRRDEP